MNNDSKYVAVGLHVIWGYIDVYLRKSSGNYDNHFTRQDLRMFFEKYCNLLLISYGSDFDRINKVTPKGYDTFNEKISKIIQKARTGIYFDSPNIRFWCDSGGFQVAEGRLNRNGVKNLEEMFYSFLLEYSEVYDRAFILDFPPGPKCVAFSDYDQLYEANQQSYLRAADLPDHVREKIIYVHHTRTPKLMEIFRKILRDNDLFRRFNNFATGAMASNYSSDTRTPYLIYALPLVQLLNEAIRTGRKEFGYHALGTAAPRSLFSYEFLKHHIQKVHGITVNFTFDSTNCLNPWLGRPFPILDGEKIHMYGKSAQFNRVDQRKKVIDLINYQLKLFAKEVNFKEIEAEYRIDGNWAYDTSLYLTLYVMYCYKQLEIMSIEKVKELYPIYESGDRTEFNLQIGQIFQNLSGGKITPKNKAKFHALGRTLDLLTSLDEEHCKHIADTYFARTEFTNLISENQPLTI